MQKVWQGAGGTLLSLRCAAIAIGVRRDAEMGASGQNRCILAN
ncbi:hypothetical protein [Selenomonas dianae]|nr:hypothetical protein [Selenomonas dianae]WLD82295.1 hypothetical protein QU667_10910 [Selenomonas dianae]